VVIRKLKGLNFTTRYQGKIKKVKRTISKKINSVGTETTKIKKESTNKIKIRIRIEK